MRLREFGNGFYLREAPQHVGDEDWSLSSEQINKEYLGKLMKGSTKHLEDLGTYNGLQLYRYRKEVFAVDLERTTNRLVYWVKIEVRDEPDLGTKSVTQRAVWRDRTTPATNGLSSKVFWDIWLPQYHSIATDTLQTSDGRAFWNIRVEEGFKKGLDVFLFDTTVHPKKLTKILDFPDFIQMTNQGKIWGTTPEYQQRRIIMTDRQLAPKSDIECEL